jgi:hypothetical protein
MYQNLKPQTYLLIFLIGFISCRKNDDELPTTNLPKITIPGMVMV